MEEFWGRLTHSTAVRVVKELVSSQLPSEESGGGIKKESGESDGDGNKEGGGKASEGASDEFRNIRMVEEMVKMTLEGTEVITFPLPANFRLGKEGHELLDSIEGLSAESPIGLVASLTVQSMHLGNSEFVRRADMKKRCLFPIPRCSDCDGYAETLFQETDDLKEVAVLLMSDDCERVACGLHLIIAGFLLCPKFLGRTLRCLADASVTSEDVLTAIWKVLSSDSTLHKICGLHVLDQMLMLPLKQWQFVNERLHGLQTLIDLLKTSSFQDLNSEKLFKNAVPVVLSLIWTSCLEPSSADALLPRLAACGLVGNLLGLLDTDLMQEVKEAQQGRPSIPDLVVGLLFDLSSRVEISVEIEAFHEALGRLIPWSVNENGQQVVKHLQQLRPLNQVERERLRRGSLVRLRGMRDSELSPFNNCLADVRAKLPDGTFRVVPREGGGGRDKNGQQPTLALPVEHLVGCVDGFTRRPAKEFRHSMRRHVTLAGTCANAECGSAPENFKLPATVDWAKQNLMTCRKCSYAQYCSSACQKVHWKAHHKKECSFLQSWQGIDQRTD
uniref:MYND-type domain-containing protein n=1 Tax=Chromera velia CCMP2878 TaxID=1169474 RepID=A0A0G4HDB3_9ALVE|eukprot:Cvel_26238.t1-p1 / transcript=Cvel_26238.t1 / gene=Cvel_26238 / organism=Chromera_velia_CCMP2878 / gene_product=hypothetical protein / transcript_product=hypothetical protein / location=Cvel_scaffold3093:13881-15962(-) / protein_length=557 / sequence_SO=supercontig / SO=protein_coding / is_pseudo=false